MGYNLAPEEIELCKKKKEANNQLAFGLMLVYFKEHIKFPSNNEATISKQALCKVASSLSILLPKNISFD